MRTIFFKQGKIKSSSVVARHTFVLHMYIHVHTWKTSICTVLLRIYINSIGMYVCMSLTIFHVYRNECFA